MEFYKAVDQLGGELTHHLRLIGPEDPEEHEFCQAPLFWGLIRHNVNTGHLGRRQSGEHSRGGWILSLSREGGLPAWFLVEPGRG